MQMHKRRNTGLAIIAAVVLLLTGCGLGGDPLSDPPEEGPEPRNDPVAMPTEPVLIGWVGEEQELIAEAYAGALRGDGAEAETQQYPTRGEAVAALNEGSVHVLPDYTGEALIHFDQGNPAVGNIEDELSALNELVGDNVRVTTAASSGSRLVFVIPAAVTEQYDLATLSDAGEYLSGKTLGGPEDLADAPYGPAGLSGLYGINVDFAPITDPDEVVRRLNSGDIGLGALRSTDPRIDLLVTLDDPQQMVPANAIVPLMRAELADGPVASTINEVQAELDEEGLLDLTADVDSPADEAAAAWLESNGLG